MNKRISLSLFYIGALSAITAILLTAGAFRINAEKQAKVYLKEELRIISHAYSYIETPESLAHFASDLIRITLIDSSGEVLFDSEKKSEDLENHLDRPEVSEALQTGSAESYRTSETLKTDLYYFAQKLQDGRLLRLSMKKANLFSLFSSVYPHLITLFTAIMLLFIFCSFWLTKQFLKPIHQIAQRLDLEEIVDDDVEVYQELVPFIAEIQRQRKKTERELRRLAREKEKLSVLIKNVPEGLFILDRNQNVIMINEEAKKIFNVHEELELHHIIYYSRNLHLKEIVNKAFLNEKVVDEILLDGKLYQLLVAPITVSSHFLGVIALFIDLTEKQKIEQWRREFTANASHELKTPLTIIMGYTEMIVNNMVKKTEIPRFAEKIDKEAKRMLLLTEDIMKLAELDEVRFEEVAKDDVDLLAVAKETLSSLETIADSRKVSLQVSGVSSKILGNRRLLYEMIFNLVENAIRYNREGGSVVVQVEEKSISVRDTGIGIPAESQERIFERFYRVDKSRSKETGGTGLGLAIVKHVAETHHAKIHLTSKEGEGTEIRIDF